MSEKRKPGRPKGRKPSYTISARVSPVLGDALEAYIEHTRPTPTNTAVVELALERLLAEQGFWPWPPPKDRPHK